MSLYIDAHFEGGNIEVVEAADPANIRLRIVPDHGTSYLQWFCFRLCGARGRPCRIIISNAYEAYVGGWEGYRAVASVDRRYWFRVDTALTDEGLLITHTPAVSSIWFAYFAPYALERHHDLVASALCAGADLDIVGSSCDGRNLDVLVWGTPSAPLNFWIIGRQHPGETMASWWMQGFIGRLLDGADPTVRDLLAEASLHVIPMMNPDGVVRGYLRTNAAGVDLNRAWANPDPGRAPEVACVRKRMLEIVPDLCLDVHGTEDIRHVFIVPPEGPRGNSRPLVDLTEEFKRALTRTDAEFDPNEGFPPLAPHEADISMCGNWLAERLGTLGLTLEMPFADRSRFPDVVSGWSPERAERLGQHYVDALAAIAPSLAATKSLRRGKS